MDFYSPKSNVQNLSFIYERTFDNYFKGVSVMFTHEKGRLFHGEGADLTWSLLFELKDFFKMFMYIYFYDLFDLSHKQGGGGL